LEFLVQVIPKGRPTDPLPLILEKSSLMIGGRRLSLLWRTTAERPQLPCGSWGFRPFGIESTYNVWMYCIESLGSINRIQDLGVKTPIEYIWQYGDCRIPNYQMYSNIPLQS